MTQRTSWAHFISAVVTALIPGLSSATPLDSMVSPVTHPTVFEDPRHSSELRPIYAYHRIDDGFVTEGGNVQIYALQARFKVDEDLSIIATKDGFVDFNPDTGLSHETGFANVGAGAKYSFYRCDESIVTGGLRYEIPMGHRDVLQGGGDGDVNPFVSAGAVFGNLNLMANTGFRVAIDNEYSSFYDLNLHASYRIDSFYPLVEFGLVTTIDDGKKLPIADEGQDFFNLGASRASGHSIATLAVGGRYRVTEKIDVGAAWQFPLDSGTGTRIIDYRVTADAIVRFDL